ncbi:hypothetical protein V496_09067 [Pseudogymnoascus sp. VKM F-4515 (FW-2607)]|nr:hypothetical protein V496_09067 [Pseudogymnoascus sp. VKM F-4515 (FW-2607)]
MHVATVPVKRCYIKVILLRIEFFLTIVSCLRFTLLVEVACRLSLHPIATSLRALTTSPAASLSDLTATTVFSESILRQLAVRLLIGNSLPPLPKATRVQYVAYRPSRKPHAFGTLPAAPPENAFGTSHIVIFPIVLFVVDRAMAPKPYPYPEGLMPKKSPLVPAKLAYYAATAAGFPLDPDGVAVWDPVIGSEPIRPSIIPCTQPISHAVMAILKFWAALPSTNDLHITTIKGK